MSKKRIAPSEQLSKAVEEVMSRLDREVTGGELLGEVARFGARRLIQEALEREQAEYLEPGRRSAPAKSA